MYCKNIQKISLVIATVLLIVVSCSFNRQDETSGVTNTVAVVSTSSSAESFTTRTMIELPSSTFAKFMSVTVRFVASNSHGTIEISGDDSPVVVWFSSQPGEVSLDLLDADAADDVSVVEEVVGFWFFRDENSGDVVPSIFESSVGVITDSVGTRYVVAAELLGPAPGTETTTTPTSAAASTTTASATSSVPDEETGTSEAPSTTSTTSTSTTTSTTTTTIESPVVLQVQVLNGSGVAGAAGRLTDKLSQAGYAVLSPENAPQRYSSSAVYYAEGWQAKAEEILDTAGIDEVEEVTAMPQIFASQEAAVVVLLGTDTAPAIAVEQAGLRPRPNFDVKLPLGDDVPRDRFVPGLANIQIYSRVNDEGSDAVKAKLDELKLFVRYAGQYSPDGTFGIFPNERDAAGTLQQTWQLIEDTLLWFGFTPQNICGAPAGYSFTDLLKPTREWNESTRTYSGDAIFTTDRLIELHGGERINPESNLDFYIQQAVQASYDTLRSAELLSETESMQLILCEALVSPSGEIPEYANSLWYANLTPGIQPRESLLSQGTYHVKEISRNGNIAYVLVCHPTLGEQNMLIHWREVGYRAEVVGSRRNFGCQQSFERETYIYEDTNGAEDTFYYGFGERVFSGSDFLGFPRD